MSYDVEKYQKLRSLEVPRNIALALANEESPVGGVPTVESSIEDLSNEDWILGFADDATRDSVIADIGISVNEIISILRESGIVVPPAPR